MNKKLLILLTFGFSFLIGNTQSLLHSKPLEYNTGFAGAKKYDRISFHVNELSEQSSTAYFSYDRFLKALKGGIGLYISHKNNTLAGSTVLIEQENEISEIGVVYSPKIIVKEKILISPSFKSSYSKFNITETQKIDEVNSLLHSKTTHSFIGNSIGILVNNKKGYLGYEFKSQLGYENHFQHVVIAGYVHEIVKNQNFMIDLVYRKGTLLEDKWRTYQQQINGAYQYGILYFGAGLNDYKYASLLVGVKINNLKITTAYHILSPANLSNAEFGIQYVFNTDNPKKLVTPFKKWWIKLKM